MSRPTGFGVIRRAADLPEEFRTGELDGKWFELPDPRAVPVLGERHDGGEFTAIAVPTGRFEANEAGVVAEVYEIRP